VAGVPAGPIFAIYQDAEVNNMVIFAAKAVKNKPKANIDTTYSINESSTPMKSYPYNSGDWEDEKTDQSVWYSSIDVCEIAERGNHVT
jgi:hypothetical protein